MLMCYHNTVRNAHIPRCVLYIYDGYIHNMPCMFYKKRSHDVHTTLFTTSIHSLNILRVSILLILLVLLVSNGYV